MTNPQTAAPEAAPLLIGRNGLSARLALSPSTVDRPNSAGKLSMPLKLGGRLLWQVAEVEAWTRAGCPERQVWAALWADHSKRINIR